MWADFYFTASEEQRVLIYLAILAIRQVGECIAFGFSFGSIRHEL